MDKKEKRFRIIRALGFYVWNYDDVEDCQKVEEILMNMIKKSKVDYIHMKRFN